MSTGYITVKVFTAEKAMPVPKAQIRIVDLRIALDQTIYTDSYGNAERIKVYAPDKATSLKPQDISLPYETYNVEIMKEGYIPTVINNVPVFAGETCLQPVSMIPQPEGQNFANLVNNIDIPPNGLQLKTERRLVSQAAGTPQLKQVVIPEYIRVHLGEPDSEEKTILVPFCEYVKNVASSEIYSTWPKESLIANILAIISFALNRIYTGYYTSQGKDFDITSMPDRDPYFVEGRNLYANICDLVDGICNKYIKRTGLEEPLLANYCNGITNRCEGISQWGSVTLANQGQSADDILKYYYGNVQTETAKDIKGVEKKFPGILRVGDIGENVMALQKQLNQIGKTYGNIPPIPKENGNYDGPTHDAVIAFQKQFNLQPDGIVGEKTWYQIAFAYNNVKRLQNLSRMRREITVPSAAPGTALRAGSTGGEVRLLQYLLSAAGVFYNSVLPVDVTGTYDQSTEKAVRSFQKTFALPQTGVADKTTWNALLNVYKGIEQQVGAVLDNLQNSVGQHAESGERKTLPESPGPEMRRFAPAEQTGRREMERRRTEENMGRGPGREDARSVDEERIRAAMNYADMEYKLPPRSMVNMAYSADIKDYVPDGGLHKGLDFLWTRGQPAEQIKTPSGSKTGGKDFNQTRTEDVKPAGTSFQYTPWIVESQAAPFADGRADRQDEYGPREGGQDADTQMRDGWDTDMSQSREEPPAKSWTPMDDTVGMGRQTPYSYMPANMDDEMMFTRPGTKVTPGRPMSEPERMGADQAGGRGRDSQQLTQRGEQPRQGRQAYPIRMPGAMPSGTPSQPGAVLPGDDGDEEYTCPDPPLADPVYPNATLKIGSKGKDVQLMQEYLSYIALSLIRYKLITNEMKVIVNDGIYGIDTTDAVIRFQNRYEMPVNGVIDAATWAKIIEVYNNPCE